MKNIDVGIITYHDAHNYGAVLQAYALKKVISSLSKEVCFIGYSNEKLKNGYSLFPSYSNSVIKYAKDAMNLILDYDRKKSRFNAFNSFVNNYLSAVSVSSGKVNYKNVVIGSDQVWNVNYTDGVDPVYFGKHNNILSNNIISYAASAGVSNFNLAQEIEIAPLLSNMKMIGVREKTLQSYLKKRFDIDTTLNLDPTLLLEDQKWKELGENSSENLNGVKYLLVYEVQSHILTEELTNFISDKLGLEVKILASRTNYKTSKNIITTASPEDFLNLFENASFVLTTSFHGTVFSIINNKEFLTLKFGNELDLRSESLLEVLDIQSRHIDHLSNKSDLLCKKIPYERVQCKLSDLRAQSIDYLEKYLR